MTAGVTAPATAPPPPAIGRSLRRRVLAGFAVILAVVGAVVLAYSLLVGRYRESTENAYVVGDLVQLTPRVAGTVVAIHGDDADFVTAGQPLVELDRADAEVALAAAEAQLAKAVRDVRALYSATEALQATLAVRDSELTRAHDDLARRESLVATGAVSGEELEHARAALAAARAAQASARQQWQGDSAQTEGTALESHPVVQQAAARVREAYLAYARCLVAAPVSGYVARRTAQLGQRAQPGVALLVIVPLEDVWVEANLKENQLRNLRIGQPVRLAADLYGSSVEYHGRVEGLAAGTGSVFSLLPAQNATGNWIKVVQRLAVRITLDRNEVREHPLRVGLSIGVVVDTHDRSGAQLAVAAPAAAHYPAVIPDPALADADARIAAIIRANAPAATRRATGGGRPVVGAPAPPAHDE